MPIAEAYRPNFTIKKTEAFVSDGKVETRKLPENGVESFITHFDQNWRQEKLPQDWYKLRSLKGKHIGFSMQSQMDLLHDSVDKASVESWTQKTKQDLLGFKLEYLSDHIVYPCKYERSSTDPTRLENSLYGNADMVETVSENERNGSVVRGLREMKSFFLADDTPDGSIAVMTSPIGPSGLKTDDGKDIRYPDSYFFIMQKQGETVNNYTLKTDFSIPECREAIYRLTGKRLSPAAPLEEYVKSIAKIRPGDHGAVPNVNDVVGTLELIKPEYAWKPEGKNEKISWQEVYADVLQSEQLYEFNQKTQEIIEEFEAYCLEGNHSKQDLQKAVAATILRMSKVFFTEEQKSQQQEKVMQQNKWIDLQPPFNTFGGFLEAASERPGCAGGGASNASGSYTVNSITSRLGTTKDKYGSLNFECPFGHKNTRPEGELIPKCTTCGESVSC